MRTPKNVAFGYDVGKISAGCPVVILTVFVFHMQFFNHFCNVFRLTLVFPFVIIYNSAQSNLGRGPRRDTVAHVRRKVSIGYNGAPQKTGFKK